MLKSKMLSILAIIAAIALIGLTFPYRTAWWAFIDVFCFFMATFLHFMAVLQPSALAAAGRRIDFCAFIFLIVGVLSLIVEALIFSFS